MSSSRRRRSQSPNAGPGGFGPNPNPHSPRPLPAGAQRPAEGGGHRARRAALAFLVLFGVVVVVAAAILGPSQYRAYQAWAARNACREAVASAVAAKDPDAALDAVEKLLESDQMEFPGYVHVLELVQNPELKPLLSDGQLARAAEILKRGLRYFPNQPVWRRELRAIAIRRDDLPMALEQAVLLARAPGVQKTEIDAALADLRGLDEFPETKAAQSAILEKLLESDFENAEYLREAARLDVDFGRSDRALGRLAALVRENPLDADLRYLVGEAQRQKGQFNEALQSLDVAIRQNPKLVAAYEAKGRILLESPTTRDQLPPLLEALVKANPDDPRALLARARLTYDRDPEAAKADLAAAANLDPERLDVALARFAALLADKNYGEARQVLERARARRPRNARLQSALATVQINEGKLDDAIETLKRGLADNPDDTVLRDQFAHLLLDLDRDEEASELLDKWPGNPSVEPYRDVLRARLFVKRNDWALAARLLERVLPDMADNPVKAMQAGLLLAECFNRLGQPERQFEAMRQALALVERAKRQTLEDPTATATADPAGAVANLEEKPEGGPGDDPERPTAVGGPSDALVDRMKIRLADMMLARTLAQPPGNREWKRVDEAIEDAARARPGSADVAILRARALVERERLSDARRILEAARRDNPENPAVWLYSVLLAERDNRRDEARTLLNLAGNALRDNPTARYALLVDAWSALPHPDANDRLRGIAEELLQADFPEVARYRFGVLQALLPRLAPPAFQALLDRALEKTPEDLELQLLNLEFALQTGDVPRLESFRDRLKPRGDNWWRVAEAARLLALARRNPQLDAQKDLEPLSEVLDQLEKGQPDWFLVPLLRSEVHELRGREAEAIADANRALRLNPRQPGAVQRLATLLARRERWNELEQLVRSQENRAPLPEAVKLLALDLAIRRGDANRARELALGLSPQSAETPEGLLLRARALALGGNPAAAVAPLRQAIDRATDSASAARAASVAVEILRPLRREQELQGLLDAANAKLAAADGLAVRARDARLGQNPEAADRDYRAAIETLAGQNPQSPALAELRLEHARLLFASNRQNEAEAGYRKVLEPGSSAAGNIRAAARRELALLLAAGEDRSPQRLAEAAALLDANRAENADTLADRRVRALLTLQTDPDIQKSIDQLEAIAKIDVLDAQETYLLATLYAVYCDWPRAGPFRGVPLAVRRGLQPGGRLREPAAGASEQGSRAGSTGGRSDGAASARRSRDASAAGAAGGGAGEPVGGAEFDSVAGRGGPPAGVEARGTARGRRRRRRGGEDFARGGGGGGAAASCAVERGRGGRATGLPGVRGASETAAGTAGNPGCEPGGPAGPGDRGHAGIRADAGGGGRRRGAARGGIVDREDSSIAERGRREFAAAGSAGVRDGPSGTTRRGGAVVPGTAAGNAGKPGGAEQPGVPAGAEGAIVGRGAGADRARGSFEPAAGSASGHAGFRSFEAPGFREGGGRPAAGGERPAGTGGAFPPVAGVRGFQLVGQRAAVFPSRAGGGFEAGKPASPGTHRPPAARKGVRAGRQGQSGSRSRSVAGGGGGALRPMPAPADPDPPPRRFRSRSLKRDIEFGDFQTPLSLARAVCAIVAEASGGGSPGSVVEPSCGRGAFLVAAREVWPGARLVGVEIHAPHLRAARAALHPHARLHRDDVFRRDWRGTLAELPKPVLVLGNPPWVTNAAIGASGGRNLPAKSNFQRLPGLEAITGKANFDIAESIILALLRALGPEDRLAMLCKTAVARRILARAWDPRAPIAARDPEIRKLDARAHFGAQVDAALLHLAIGSEGDRKPDCDSGRECPVFEVLTGSSAVRTLAWREGRLVADAALHDRWRGLSGRTRPRWRSGIKHDRADVMELEPEFDPEEDDGRDSEPPRIRRYRNGRGEVVELESEYLYPMLKGSEIHVRPHPSAPRRYMLVPQKAVGEDTAPIRDHAPLTWAYLERHGESLARRASAVYRRNPPFSVFGVGPYAFAPWKVALSAFQKSARFALVGNRRGKPFVLDDTACFLPANSEGEARRLLELLESEPAREFYRARVFPDAKRPLTIEILQQLDLEALADHLRNG